MYYVTGKYDKVGGLNFSDFYCSMLPIFPYYEVMKRLVDFPYVLVYKCVMLLFSLSLYLFSNATMSIKYLLIYCIAREVDNNVIVFS